MNPDLIGESDVHAALAASPRTGMRRSVVRAGRLLASYRNAAAPAEATR